MTAHINIGSNTGNRADIIDRAVALLTRRWGPVRVSAPVESAPWGYHSTNAYLNVGVAVEVADEAPESVLAELLAMERSLGATPHRNADGSYCDRNIDIDLIAIDDVVCHTPQLTLPHPRMHLRPFVLEPLARLEPGWRHPVSLLTAAEMLGALAAESEQNRAESHSL